MNYQGENKSIQSLHLEIEAFVDLRRKNTFRFAGKTEVALEIVVVVVADVAAVVVVYNDDLSISRLLSLKEIFGDDESSQETL